MRMLERECEGVAAAARRLASEGLVPGSAGNISARVGELVAVTPTGAQLGKLTADEIVVIELDGTRVQGELAATSELGLHLGVYRLYGAGAVVHTHPPVGTALSCVLDELPVVHYQMLVLGGSVRVAPYATFGTRELANLTLDALRDRGAALMANHGAIAHGSDLDDAVERSLLLEWACKVYWHAAALGTPRVLDEEQLTAVRSAATARGHRSLGGGS